MLGKQLDRGEIATRQARLLLHRYGILVKECYRRESGLLPWYEIFQVLKRLEWQGEIRRGYFIAGLSGVQFALPEAVALLEQIQTGGEPVKNDAVLLSTADPALPLGGTPGREMQDMHGNKISMVRARPPITLCCLATVRSCTVKTTARVFGGWRKFRRTKWMPASA